MKKKNTYAGNDESQTLQLFELTRSDSEKISVGIENSAGGTLVSRVGIVGQQEKGGTYYEMLLMSLPSSIILYTPVSTMPAVVDRSSIEP